MSPRHRYSNKRTSNSPQTQSECQSQHIAGSVSGKPSNQSGEDCMPYLEGNAALKRRVYYGVPWDCPRNYRIAVVVDIARHHEATHKTKTSQVRVFERCRHGLHASTMQGSVWRGMRNKNAQENPGPECDCRWTTGPVLLLGQHLKCTAAVTGSAAPFALEQSKPASSREHCGR
jgi:hypothetical protein